MDRAEGALLVAERALQAVQALSAELNALRKQQDRSVSFLVSESGELLMTSSDGSVKQLGRVRGRDAVSIVDATIGREGDLVLKMSDGSMIRPGRVVGKDGEPGLGFEDFVPEWEDDRTLALKWTRGEHVHDVKKRFPVMLYREVYKADEQYERGDAVTFGGSIWVALKDTQQKPGTGEDWRMAVRAGRDGRDVAK